MIKRCGWTMAAALLGLILSSVLGIGSAAACVPMNWVNWPSDEQQGVPLNADIFVICDEMTCDGQAVRLYELPGRVEVPLALIESEPASCGSLSRRYEVQDDLKASTGYEVVIEGASQFFNEDGTISLLDEVSAFTTGTAVDDDPPEVSLESIEASVQWVEAGKEVEMAAGSLGFFDVDVTGWTEEQLAGKTLLPEHYHVLVSVDDIDEATKSTILKVKQFDADGNEETLTPLGARIEDAVPGEVRIYRLQWEDILGNVQPETVDVRVTFAEGASTVTVKKSSDGSEDDDMRASGGAAGCSLNPQAAASDGAWAVVAATLISGLVLVRRSRRARVAAALAALGLAAVLVGCGSGTDAGARAETGTDCASYGGTLSDEFSCRGITAEACASLRGEWGTTVDGGGDPYCELPSSDAGTVCTDWSECEKYCQVVCDDDDPGCNVVNSPNTEFGRCAEFRAGLCMYYWEDGEQGVVCADPVF